MNQSELLAITFNFLKARKNLAYKVRLGLVCMSLVEKLIEPITYRGNRHCVRT